MTDQRPRLRQLLSLLEQEMRQQQLWQGLPPAPAAFASNTPFHADTMTFQQWLQWVFIPRFQALLDSQQPLPGSCQIAPMAEEAFRDSRIDSTALLALLAEFDGCFD